MKFQWLKLVDYQQSYDFWIDGFSHCTPEVLFPSEPGVTKRNKWPRIWSLHKGDL